MTEARKTKAAAKKKTSTKKPASDGLTALRQARDELLRVALSLGMSVKLPRTADLVLALPFAEPTGYGLGRAGWVTVRIPAAELPPLGVLVAWIEESFRAVAPETKLAELDARGPILPNV